MNIEETTETKTPARKKKRKPAKKRAAPNTAPRKPADGVYAGLTVKECCTDCNADGCVISGKPYCAHPRKGGLHGTEMQDSGAMNRRREAEKVLGRQKLVAGE